MFSSHYVMALLALFALSAKVAESDFTPETCSAEEVTASTNYCLNCKTKAKCAVVGDAPVFTGTCTVPGEACMVLGGVATCVPSANTECVCDGGTDTKCDPYDSNSLLICGSTGGTFSVDCSCSSTSETCVNGACGTPTSTTTTVEPENICVGAGDGIVVIKPMCTTGAYCQEGETLLPFDCPSGTYLDGAARGCMPLPADPCAGCDGACPDKSDCSKYHVCQGGVDLDEETCDAAFPVFDIVSFECVAAGTCTENDGCTYGQTTIVATTTVSTDDICLGAADGEIVISKPICTKGAYCMDDQVMIPFDCPSGTYLDVAEKGCMPLPPDPCADCDGACPDKSDCSKYHVCQGGVDLDEETCDAAIPVFDIVTSECVPEAAGTCTENDGCTYGLTTIVATTTLQ